EDYLWSELGCKELAKKNQEIAFSDKYNKSSQQIEVLKNHKHNSTLHSCVHVYFSWYQSSSSIGRASNSARENILHSTMENKEHVINRPPLFKRYNYDL
ncbi:hypothetical protein CR513_58722, partial [Mucuna pruriens]